ncbi:MAG: hypothetical protein J6T54_02165 [Fibrobacter sp.]|nr:hypothetical protein [Fibrobacter sp.]
MYENTDDDDAVELEDFDDFAEEEELDVDFLLEELLPFESEDLTFEVFEEDESSEESLESLLEEDDSASEISFSGDEVEPSPLQANNVIAIVAMIGLSRKVFIVPSFP